MESGRTAKHRNALIVIALAMTVMIGLVAYSPTLYRMFCAVTGFGGTINRASVAQASGSAQVAAPVLTMHFDSNVAPDLNWTFEPEQVNVKARVGEPVKVYYHAKNNSNETIVGRAVYNLTPYKVAPYFYKIECFCFTEQRLGPGEEARMPLVFYIDEQFMKDKDVADATNLVLSYTFYKQDGLSPEEIEAARDLKRGSEALDESLAHEEPEFNNDAPRR